MGCVVGLAYGFKFAKLIPNPHPNIDNNPPKDYNQLPSTILIPQPYPTSELSVGRWVDVCGKFHGIGCRHLGDNIGAFFLGIKDK